MSQLKDIYTQEFLTDFANQVSTFQPSFESSQFINNILTGEWDDLSVRQRMQKIATVLGQELAVTYPEQLAIILKLHKNNHGFNYLFLPDFVSIYGLNNDYFVLSLTYLKELTAYSSAEFAIRPFIKKDEAKVRPYLVNWSMDPNEHVRRLASEGSRPRLPWGVQLKQFIDNPEENISILSALRNDSSLYVRKSVANHLNDISKNHPDLIVKVCQTWHNESPETDWIIKRACRTMVKNAYAPALAMFGYDAPGTSFIVEDVAVSLSHTSLKIGDSLTFSYHLETTIAKNTAIRLEYGINYMKANGKLALKKFHLVDSVISTSHLNGRKTISFMNLSTRKHYVGQHELLLFCNGQELTKVSFKLT